MEALGRAHDERDPRPGGHGQGGARAAGPLRASCAGELVELYSEANEAADGQLPRPGRVPADASPQRCPAGRRPRPRPPDRAASSSPSAPSSARSSSTTSPCSRTLGELVERRGALRDDRHRAAGASGSAAAARRPGGPPARSRCRAAGRRPRTARGRARAPPRASMLAEQHHVGLQRLAAALAARHAVGVGGEPRARLLELGTAPPQDRQEQRRDRAVHLDQLARARRRWSMSTFWVITASSSPARSSVDERAVGAVGLLVARASRSARRRSPRSAPGPRGRRRCARPPSGRRAPTARCPGERKSGIPDGTEMPAPVSATTEPRARAISSAEARDSSARRARPALRRRAPPRSAAFEARRAFAEERGDALLGVGAGEDRRRSLPSRPRCPRRGRPRRRRA